MRAYVKLLKINDIWFTCLRLHKRIPQSIFMPYDNLVACRRIAMTAKLLPPVFESCYSGAEGIWPRCVEPYSAGALIRRFTQATDCAT